MKLKLIIALSLSVLLLGSLSLFGDSTHDTLPLGPSSHKYKITKVEKDQIMQTNDEKMVSVEEMVKANPSTDVFVIGEAHTSYECHTFQEAFIEALYKDNPKVVVGFEFFLREHDEYLEQWRLGKITEEELLKKTGWYKKTSYNYGYTRLIMDLIKKYKIKVIGLNISRDILRKVSRKGFGTLDKEEKALFPTIGIYNKEHEYFIKSIFGSFGVQVPMWFTNIYNAQKCWDVIMAESMRRTLAKPGFKGYRGVIIAGSNHVAYKLGIPFRYNKAQRRAKITTIVPVFLPPKDDKEGDEEEDAHPMMKMMSGSLAPAAIFSRGIADYVFSVPRPEYDHFPMLGFKVKLEDGKLQVTDVTKNSIAEANGIGEGDIIISLDGVDVASVEQMRLILSAKNWDDEVSLELAKKIAIKKPEKEEKKEK